MVLEFGLKFNNDLFPASSVSGQGMNADPNVVIWTDVGVGIVPIGAIVAWHKDLANTPPLIPSFVECNGQVLSDGDSPYDGATLPNLNASGGGYQRFLRGDTTSGGTGGDESHGHTNQTGGPVGGSNSRGNGSLSFDGHVHTISGDSHLNPYFEVVWVMRIK